MPMTYHVWGAMLEHYQIHMPKLTNIMLSWMTVLSTIRKDLLHGAIISFLQQISIVCRCNWWAITLWTLFRYHMSYRQLTLIIKTFELLMKRFAKFDSLFVNIQCAIVYSLEQENFKLLYLLNHTSYFNKICRICCLNTKSESLAQISTPMAKIQNFFLGDCFLLAHPVEPSTTYSIHIFFCLMIRSCQTNVDRSNICLLTSVTRSAWSVVPVPWQRGHTGPERSLLYYFAGSCACET